MVTSMSELGICVWLETAWAAVNAPAEFTVLKHMGQAKENFRTLNFRKENSQVFKELVSRTSWETALRNIGEEQSLQTFKDTFHRSPKISVSRCKKSGI